MKFITDYVPNVTVVSEGENLFEIKSMQELDERDDRVYLRCAEYVDLFKRGLVCDLVAHFHIGDMNRENTEPRVETIKDLVLVHINKTWDMDGIPRYEYIFYK